ncbi:hypothetical protein GCM10010286_57510 [Streptomyces toxytricini]|nr:hypothetical protein GCM10010286_57510 [Streptomyces toxytricini]
MSRGSSAIAAASLPGVRLWTGRVLGDLRAGRSCLCLLPRTPAGGADAGAVLDELLHELGDFVLLPAPRPQDAADPPAAELPMPPAGPWTDTAPVLDYDDGLSAFGVRPRAGEPVPPAAASRGAATALGRADRAANGPGAAASAPAWGREAPHPHGPANGTPKEPGTIAAASPPGGKATATPGPQDQTAQRPDAAAPTPATGQDVPHPHGPANGTPQQPGTIAAASPPGRKATAAAHSPADRTGMEPDSAASTATTGRINPLAHDRRADRVGKGPGAAAPGPAGRTGRPLGAAASAPAAGRDVPSPPGQADRPRKEPGAAATASPPGGRESAASGPADRTGGGPGAASAPAAGREVTLASGRADGPRQGPGPASSASAAGGEVSDARGHAGRVRREPGVSAGSAADVGAAPSAAGTVSERGLPTAHDLADRILKELDAAVPAAGSGPAAGVDGLLHRLTDGSAAASRVIVVRGWYEPAPAAAPELLRRLAAAVKAAGLPPERRPRLLVLAGPSGLAAELPEQVAREDVAVHWWWGVHGRLDTATVVAMARPPAAGRAARHQLLEAVAQATVVEVCGPFLDLAERLAAEWDGRPDTLPPQLYRLLCDDGLLPGAADADDAARTVPAARRPAPGAALPAPVGALREDWDGGLADRWDGRLRHWPGTAAGRDPRTGEAGTPEWDWEWERGVRTRIWLAQNTALLPLLDEAREAFTEVIRSRSRLPLPDLAARYGPRRDGVPGPRPGTTGAPGSAAALAGMELGDMWRAYLQGDTRLSQPEADRLRTLWRSRNSLSHREALDSNRLEHLADHLTR